MIEIIEQIGVGATADIFLLSDGRALKLFKNGYSSDMRDYEYNKARAVNVLDFSKPEVFEAVEYDGRFGYVMERIEGESLLEQVFAEKVALVESGKIMARLHKMLLSCTLPEGYNAESYKGSLEYGITHTDKLSETQKARFVDYLHGLEDTEVLCHGDFHLGNILIREGKEPVIIDFCNICAGSPYADIMRTHYLTELSPVNPDEDAERLLYAKKVISDAYREELGTFYDKEKCEAWLPVILAGRLNEGVGDFENEHIRNMLNDNYKQFMGE